MKDVMNLFTRGLPSRRIHMDAKPNHVTLNSTPRATSTSIVQTQTGNDESSSVGTREANGLIQLVDWQIFQLSLRGKSNLIMKADV